MPAFEDSGTVNDLMVGVSDAGFLNVLDVLQGSETPRCRPSRLWINCPEQPEPARYADFYKNSPQPAISQPSQPAALPAPLADKPVVPAAAYDFDFGTARQEIGQTTVAQVILQSTQAPNAEKSSLDDLSA